MCPDFVLQADIPGVVTGLAWTPTGGQLLYIEATTMAGSGLVKLTGQLGDVMQESAHTALSWIRSHAQQVWGCEPLDGAEQSSLVALA